MFRSIVQMKSYRWAWHHPYVSIELNALRCPSGGCTGKIVFNYGMKYIKCSCLLVHLLHTIKQDCFISKSCIW